MSSRRGRRPQRGAKSRSPSSSRGGLGEEKGFLDELISTTSELESKKQVLEQYVTLYSELNAEVSKLRMELQTRDTEASRMSEYLQESLEEKNREVDRLQQTIQEKVQAVAEESLRREERLQSHIQRLVGELRDREDTIHALRDDVDDLSDWQAEKRRLEQELAHARHERDEAVHSCDDEIKKVRYKYFQEKSAMKRERAERQTLIEAEVSARVLGTLDERRQEAMAENAELRQMLSDLEHEIETHRQAKSKTEQANRQLAIEANLNEQGTLECTKKLVRQKQEIQTLKARTKALEAALQRAKTDREEERRREAEEREVERARVGEQLDSLKKVLQARTHELITIKALASEVLSQRSEVEQFFLEALQQVKEEIQRERADRQHQQQQQMSYSVPTTGVGPTPSMNAAAGAGARSTDRSLTESTATRSSSTVTATATSPGGVKPGTSGGGAGGRQPVYNPSHGIPRPSPPTALSSSPPAIDSSRSGAGLKLTVNIPTAAGKPGGKGLPTLKSDHDGGGGGETSSVLPPISQGPWSARGEISPARSSWSPKGSQPMTTQRSTEQPPPPLLSARTSQKVDIGDLSWEDREKVLRLLFAKINSNAPKRKSPRKRPATFGDEPATDRTFLTNESL